MVRHEPGIPLRYSLKAGLGAFIAIIFLGVLLDRTGLPLLIAPLGASTILVFGRPSGVLAQPVNVVGGFAVAAVVSFIAAGLAPGILWATGISIGVTLVLMRILRVTHPPAGAIPLVGFADPVHIADLFAAVLVGSTTLVLFAMIWHHLPPRQPYPKRVGRGHDEPPPVDADPEED